MRKTEFICGNYYHIYNRGVDKRDLFSDDQDINRFIQSILVFNNTLTVGGIYENYLLKKNGLPAVGNEKEKPLVRFIAYGINLNHYHFILEQLVDDGIPKFMHRISTGYTMYFNEKYKRTGSLFGGRYKAKDIDTDEYLLELSAYVNLNDIIHGLNNFERNSPCFFKGSWEQYTTEKDNKAKNNGSLSIPCDNSIILEQFKSKQDYEDFSIETVKSIIKQRKENQEVENNEGLIEADEHLFQ